MLRENARAIRVNADILERFRLRTTAVQANAERDLTSEDTDFETLMTNLLEGQFSNPVRVVAFNMAEGGPATFRKSWQWSCPCPRKSGAQSAGIPAGVRRAVRERQHVAGFTLAAPGERLS
jgi:hypothetical protein